MDPSLETPLVTVTLDRLLQALPGSVRVASTEVAGVSNVAFRTPAGQLVVIVLNEGTGPKTFGIRRGQQSVSHTLPAGAAATYVW